MITDFAFLSSVTKYRNQNNVIRSTKSTNLNKGNDSKTQSLTQSTERNKKNTKKVAHLTPVLAASFCVAVIMYPLDILRVLQMANAGSGSRLTTIQLLTKFKNTYGCQGFFTQGLVPEIVRATWLRFVKFSLFPIVHLIITNGIEESKGNSASRTLAALIGSLPEALSIMVSSNSSDFTLP